MAEQVRSDEELFIAWRDTGDRRAIAELFRRCADHAYRVALRACRRPEDAEDAVSEAFATAMRRADRFERAQSFRNWLAIIVVNAAITARRASRRRVLREHRSVERRGPGGKGDQVAKLELDETAAAAQTALHRLPEQLRAAVVLRCVENVPAREVARTLGVTERTITRRVDEGLTRLRRDLAASGFAALGLPAAVTALQSAPAPAAPGSLLQALSQLPQTISPAGAAGAGAALAGGAAAAVKAGLATKVITALVAASALAGTVMVSKGFFSDSTPPAREGELRGVWVHSPGHFEDWDAELARLREAGLNAVFLNVSDATFGHYPSDVLPDTSELYQKTGTDWVAHAVEACHRQGLEFHAWRTSFSGVHRENEIALLEAGRLMLRSDSTIYYWEGKPGPAALCPLHPANVELAAAAAEELAKRYDIDGLHLGDMRFPHTNNACFCENCRKYFLDETGLKDVRWPEDVEKGGRYYLKFLRIREPLITNVMRQVAERVRAASPEVKISAQVFRHEKYAALHVGQDWPAWVRAGYLDFVCPPDYPPSEGELRTAVSRHAKLLADRAPLYPLVAPKDALRSPNAMAARIEAMREAGADGFGLFHYGGPDGPVARALPVLSRAATKGETYTNHTSPRIAFELKVEARRLTGRVRCWLQVAGAGEVARVEIEPVVESPAGRELVRLPAATVTESAEFEVDAALRGPCRVAVYGTIHYAGGATRRFARRSRVFK